MPEALSERIFRVLTLEREVFDEVAGDERQTGPALGIVFAATLATGLGHLPSEGLRGLLLASLATCLDWVLWLGAIQAGLLAMGRADSLGPLFRAFGYAAAPFALGVLAPIPLLGDLAGLVQWALGFGAAWRATQRAGGLQLPEAGVLCFAALFVALWIRSLVLALFVPAACV